MGAPWTPAEDRFAMVRAAIEGDALCCKPQEIDRVGETYTVDTLRELRRFLPHTSSCASLWEPTLRLVWGSGARRASLAVLRGSPWCRSVTTCLDGRDLSRLAQIIDAREILQVAMPRMDVSSTDLRKKCVRAAPFAMRCQRLWQTISSHTGSTSAESLDVCKGRLIWPRPNRRKKKRS